jgi:DNA-binding transcriptional ArsR family regulator
VDKLTPTAQKTYDAIREGGPANVHELCERTGSSRAATDKALASLAKAGLTVKVPSGDPADGAPARWQLADPATAGEPAQPEAKEPEPALLEADRAEVGQTEHAVDATDPMETGRPDIQVGGTGRTDRAPTIEAGRPTDADAGTDPAAAPDAGNGFTPDGAVEQAAEPDPPKLCRGCQTQLPKVCPNCWQKTSAYCGNCRRTMPQVRKGEPGEPVILSNGLRKLRPGDNPLPHHVGVTGWTGGRVAIFLPGRSTGAINNALEKLAKTGLAELIGDKPMRYQLAGADTTAIDEDSAAQDTAPAHADAATEDAAADAPENDATA